MSLNQQQLAEGERQRAAQQSDGQSLLGWFFMFVFVAVVFSYFDRDNHKEVVQPNKATTSKVNHHD